MKKRKKIKKAKDIPYASWGGAQVNVSIPVHISQKTKVACKILKEK